LKSISKNGCIVSDEENNYHGGLGESISRILAQNNPAPQSFVATNDTFGESGTPKQLMEKYGLNSQAIIKSAIEVIKKK
jgi:transketolase